MKRRGEKLLRPVHPNAGIRAAYRKRLLALVDEMADSYRYWLEAAYKKQAPAIAMDASASAVLGQALKRLGRRWKKNFKTAAEELAVYFATASAQRSDATLRSILKKGGWTVKFRMTAAMRDVLNATIAENVSLIKSIQEEYHTQVEGMVMRSVTAGRDLSTLSTDLQERFRITKRRAEFIALDQNNKATTNLRRVRELDLGLDDGIWLHSGAGKEPRPTHVRQHGKRFSIREGWYDPAVKRKIWPGTEPRCRCTYRVVVKGFS